MTWLFLFVLQLQSTLWFTVSSLSRFDEGYRIVKDGCNDQCGKVRVPYPFGIGANCYYDASYEIFCSSSFDPPKAFLQLYNLEVMEISGLRGSQTLTVHLSTARNISKSEGKGVSRIDFRGSPYRFSGRYNKFHVWGCSGSVVLKNASGQIVGGCTSVCPSNFSVANISTSTKCYGVGCCEALILGDAQTHGLDFYDIALDDRAAPISSTTSAALTAALVGYPTMLTGYDEEDSQDFAYTILEWHANYLTQPIQDDSLLCYTDRETGFLLCSCIGGRDGNPYLDNGCQVPRECRKCRGSCSYNHTSNQYYCPPTDPMKRTTTYGFSLGAGLVLLILGCYWIYRLVKWRRDIKRKAENFKKNGGLLLQQQMSSNDGIIEKMTIFTAADLEKATDNFSKSRILGQGGQGTVYKGMLIDGRIAAVKKSMKVDESQLDQFINEMVILSQINHRNVVKVLGCCLETEVPLLVYEFIPNGTLYQHIHDPTEDFHITWKMRLQIAAESAGAIAYLHSSSSAPIYHRDIKSSNILLDDKYRAKVSDFGTSKAVNIEQTHVTTRVQGTYGYLDPEYFQSNQFTEKSDVYSFGVLLVELITGKKPVYLAECGGWKSLAVEFLCQMQNTLFDFIDKRVIEEGEEDEFIAVANLARQCLNMNGRQRPTMKEIVWVLDGIRSPNSKEQTRGNGKCVLTEISDSGPCTADTFSSSGVFPSLSMEELPLMSYTQ